MNEPRVASEYVRTAKGRYHLVALVNGHRTAREECNLDDAPGTEATVGAAELEAADPETLCRHCFQTEAEA